MAAPAYTYHPLGADGAGGAGRPASQHVRLAWQRSSRRARGADERLLRDLVEPHGVVLHLCPAVSEGKAYVTYADPTQATAAVAALNGAAVNALKGLRVEARLWGGAAVATSAQADASGEVSAQFPALPPSVPTAAVPPIRGLTLIHDFLSEGEEARLLEWLLNHRDNSGDGGVDVDAGGGGGGSHWIGGGHMARRVQHFGNGFDYVTRTLTSAAAAAAAAAVAAAAETAGASASAAAAPAPDGTAAGATADATDTAGPAMRVQLMPAEGPLHALAARVAALGALGDGGFHGWNHCASCAPVPLARLLPRRSNEDGGGADARNDTHTPLQTALVTALVSACGDAGVGSTCCGCTSKAGAVDTASPLARNYALPDQITVNEYRPGQGIGAHVDTHAGFQDGIVSVSLGAGTVMDFVRAAPNPPPAHAAAAGAGEGCVVDLAAAVMATAATDDGGRGSDGERPATLLPTPFLAAVCTRASVYLPRRSLLLMRGEARHAWTHGIPSRRVDVLDGVATPRAGTRVSITLRLARQVDGAPAAGASNGSGQPPGLCNCVWPSVCFHQSGEPSRPPVLRSPRLQRLAAMRDDDAPSQPASAVAAATAASPSPQPPAAPSLLAPDGLAPDIEARHVHALYDAIAEHFSHTRHSPWPRVQAFLRALPPGAVVVDVGCGNGKYMGLRGDVLTLGCDRSLPLVEIAGGRGHNAAVGDALAPPFRAGVADAALSIAVLHHISTRERRVALLAALLRCVRPDGGRLFVQAWAAEQGPDSRRDFSGGSDALVPWCLARR